MVMWGDKDQETVGLMHQLNQIKQMHPKIKRKVSLGFFTQKNGYKTISKP